MAENFNLASFNDGTGLVGNPNTFQSTALTIIDGESGGGGGATNGVTLLNQTTFNEYVVRVSSNEVNSIILVNGVSTQKTTPENILISKTQLLRGNIEITVIKEGFATLEKYVVSLLSPTNSVIINNSRFNQPLGLSLTEVSVKYFIGGVEQAATLNLQNGNFIFVDFTLNKTRVNPVNSELLNFNVFVTGTTNSVLITKNGKVDLYPKLGVTNYEDIQGTIFSVKSSDTKLYRIIEIIVEGEGEASETLTAGDDESLDINLTLNKSYTIKVQTKELLQSLPTLDPRISLLNFDVRTYNINSKAGVPIVVRKNSDVKVITVIVGENVYEFDSLDEGDVAGITIPHTPFRTIGQYSIKIYPFSLKDYESQVRSVDPPLVVKQNIKNIKTPVVTVTEVVEQAPITLFMSPYQLPVLNTIPTTPITSPPRPIIRTGGGSGGGTVVFDRDSGSGFGIERVAERNRINTQNIQ